MNHIMTYAYYQFKVNSRYKMNNVFSVLSTFVAVFVQYYIWKYVERVENFNTNAIAIYILCALTFSLILPIFSAADFISSKVLKGDIINFLHRPQSLFFINFGVQMGNVGYKLLYRLIPVWLLYLVFFRESFTNWQGPDSLLIVLVSVLLSWILAFILGYMIGLLSTVLISINGLKSLVSGLLLFLGGSLLPLNLYPEFIQRIVILSPFASISYYPVAMISGIASFDPLTSIFVQLAWISVASLILFRMYRYVSNKLDVMGG
ncbi:hypothetical protein [Facklamia lactis]|uniref:hypothetical protein n=1 Tax=Facklamia lactis TaxID=2749967 RepID=UPI0018CE5CF2|nr:hypothetical protein [Facklamia lactis]MBG9979573.1 hypothetical protein [Facklamia lactis]